HSGRSSPQPDHLARVRPPACRPDAGDRLLYRRDGLAPAPPRPLLIELASRKVHLGGITASPTGEWVAQQARNLAWNLQDGAVKAKFLLRDRDSKFTAAFDQVFGSEGAKVLRVPSTSAASPRFRPGGESSLAPGLC